MPLDNEFHPFIKYHVDVKSISWNLLGNLAFSTARAQIISPGSKGSISMGFVSFDLDQDSAILLYREILP